MWLYISKRYFKLKVVEEEVGSTAMPHKVNPIDFENAEGNFKLGRELCGHIADTLPISRLQRDLTDSTLLRNLGVALGHVLVGMKSLIRGLDRITPDYGVIQKDLLDHPESQSEIQQARLRKEGDPDAYEKVNKEWRR